VRRLALPTLVLLLVAGLIAFEVAQSGPTGEKKPAPPLPPTVLRPPRVTLAGLRGSPALVNFWASWCDPCRHEAPELERFYRSSRGAQLVAVDYTDQPDAGHSFLREYGWSFPVLSDPSGVYGTRYGFSGLPATVVLDSRGRIVETLQGPQTETSLREALDRARAN
jgi:cytochrome c biogenesis protein CcmG/thiol:disulfide interchange protein DsbE